MKSIVKSMCRVAVCVVALALLVGMGCINLLMFHPEMSKGGYDESTEGYVDIGTNGVKIAATRPVGGLVLEAPFLSAPRVVTRIRILPIDPFPNLKSIKKVKCPILMFHGTDDRVVPYTQGKALFARASEPKQFVSVEGGDHNDFPTVMGLGAYLQTIRDFAEKNSTKEK